MTWREPNGFPWRGYPVSWAKWFHNSESSSYAAGVAGLELTDEQGTKTEPRLPPQRRVGRRRVDDGEVVEGILYVLRTGCRWQDMPRQYGASVTTWRRLRRRVEEAV